MHFVCKDKVKRLVTTRKKPAQGRLVEEQTQRIPIICCMELSRVMVVTSNNHALGFQFTRSIIEWDF